MEVSRKFSRMAYLDNPMEYPCSGLKLSLHGNIYQLKLLMLFMIRGLKLKLRFRLATEFDPGEKFDDLFFEYENENKNGSIIRLIQVKHKQDDSKTISLNDLINETDGEFSLQKYFISYCQIIKNPEFTENTEIKDFIIYTNIGLQEDLKENFEPVRDSDVILDMTYGHRLKFKNDFPIKEKVISILKKSSESCRLANIIAKIIAESNKLDLTNEFLRNYHGFLAQDVFEITENTEECYAKFRNSFLDSYENKPIVLICLRKNLYSYLNTEQQSDLKNKKIPTSRSFGKVFHLKVNPTINESEKFAKELATSVKLAQNNIVQISRTNKIIRDNINELAGYLLIKKDDSENDIYFLSSAFFDDSPLPVELTIFRRNLNAAFQIKGIVVNKDQYKFKILNFHTCYDGELYTKASLPDDCVTEEEMEGFLNKLVFAINQPNEIQLGKIIATEISDDSNVNNDFIVGMFEIYMLNWMKRKEGTFLTFEVGKKFFEEAKSELGKLMFIGLTLDYLANMNKFCLTFNQNSINKLKMCFTEFLNSESNNHILNIFTEHIELCSIKFHQIMKVFDDYKTKGSYFFLDLSTLLRLEDELLLAFGSHTTKLLIIANDNAKNDKDNNNLSKLIDNLKPILNENSNMKVIIICSSEKNWLNNAEFNSDKYEDRNLNLTDLTLDSQEKILTEGIVTFQGHNLKLNELLNQELRTVIDGNILSNLIHKRKFNIGAELSNLGEIEDYYIMRTLKHCVNVDPAFKKKTEKFFIIDETQYFNNDNQSNEQTIENCIEKTMSSNSKLAGLNNVEPNNKQDLIFISDGTDGHFEKLCKKYSDKNVHCVQREADGFIWRESYGNDLSSLREFVDKETSNLYNPQTVTDISDKIVVIIAEPGMGKSNLLKHLAVRTKKLGPYQLILNINLIDHSVQFGKWEDHSDEITEITVKNFLYSCYLLKSYEHPMKVLEEKLFDYFYEEGNKMIVLFDGFDEICPLYKEIVIKLLNVLKKTKIERIWISTRPYNIQCELENKLNVFSYSLEPIHKENQINFFSNYWKQSLQLGEITLNSYLFINELLDWLSEITNDAKSEFVKNPLHMKMIAESFKDTFIDFIDSDRLEPYQNYKEIFLKQLNLLTLYKTFIDTKFYKILMQEKNTGFDIDKPLMKKWIDNERQIFFLNHEKLALLSLFGTDALKMLEIDMCDLVVEGMEKTGIIDRVFEEKPIFVHKSFAEYFAARWMAANWKENKVKNFLMKYIFKEKNYMIRKFFDNMLTYESNTNEKDNKSDSNSERENGDKKPNSILKNKYEFHIAILNNDVKKIKKILEYENPIKIISSLDKGGRTALHLIASYNFTEIWNLVHPEQIKLAIDQKDIIFGFTPLIYAEKCGSWNIIESLLEAETHDDMLNLNRKCKGPNKLKTSHRKKRILQNPTNQNLLNLTKVLREKEKLRKFINSKDKFGNTILNIAALNRKTEVIKASLKLVDKMKPCQVWDFIKEREVDDYTVLHISALEGQTEVAELLLKLVATKFPAKLLEFLNAKQKDGYTALYLAAKWGKIEVIKALLKSVKTPNQLWAFIKEKQLDGFTALHIAAQEGETKVVELLLELVEIKFPAKMLLFLNAKVKYGFTALHLAAIRGKTEVIKAFLKLVEKMRLDQLWDFITERQVDDYTVLHISAQAGQTEVLEVLLKFVGTKFPAKLLEFLNAKQKHGYTALYVAAKTGKTEVIKAFLKLVERIKPNQLLVFINEKQLDDYTVLHISAQEGQTEVVKLLLELIETKFPAQMFEFLNAKNINGCTSLYLAVLKGKTDVVKLLIKLAEKMKPYQLWRFIKDKQFNYYSVLHISAQEGQTEVVELLLKLVETKFPTKIFEFLNTRNIDGCTSLYLAALKGKTDVVKLLIKLAEKMKPYQLWGFIKEKSLNDYNVLHISAQEGQTEVVELLLELIETKFPAQMFEFLNAKNINGCTSLYLAAIKGKTDVVKLLIKLAEKMKSYQFWGFIKEKQFNDFRVLHISAQEGQTEVVELLLKLVETKFPAQMFEFLNAKNIDGCTALHLAVLKDKTDVVKLLIEVVKKIKPDLLTKFLNEKNLKGRNALNLARINSDIVKILINH